jgi:hypothetical protein
VDRHDDSTRRVENCQPNQERRGQSLRGWRSTGTQTARLTHDDCEDIVSDPEVEDVDMEGASGKPAAANATANPRQPHEADALQQYAVRIHENVLRTGYSEMVESWRTSL